MESVEKVASGLLAFSGFTSIYLGGSFVSCRGRWFCGRKSGKKPSISSVIQMNSPAKTPGNDFPGVFCV
ncbi:hypothetical protein ABQD61_08850 [Enterococcus asini]|uniref:hypothetical protein n=1 Tax=Enterococcus asini TaxID=57732 RepID=UPI0032E515A9